MSSLDRIQYLPVLLVAFTLRLDENRVLVSKAINFLNQMMRDEPFLMVVLLSVVILLYGQGNRSRCVPFRGTRQTTKRDLY